MGTAYVYHHNDHDGIVAAGILYNFIKSKENVSFIMIDYDKILNFDHINFNNGDKVYFLDYSFTNKENRDEFDKLLERRLTYYDVVWIDHHKSSIGLYTELQVEGIRNTELCAALWTYLYCNEDIIDKLANDKCTDISKNLHDSFDIPIFLKYIDDYDCWKQLYKDTNSFHYGFTISSPKDPIITTLLSTNSEIPYDDTVLKINSIVADGNTIMEYLKFEDKEYHIDMYGFEFTLPEEHGGYKCFCLNRKGNSIMFGNKIKEYDAVIPFYYINNKWKYSIFTDKDNVDCEKVAKSYGGGGHTKAAGWVIPELIFKS